MGNAVDSNREMELNRLRMQEINKHANSKLQFTAKTDTESARNSQHNLEQYAFENQNMIHHLHPARKTFSKEDVD